MKNVGIFYATRLGHGRAVAEHVARQFRAQGFDTDLWPVAGYRDDLQTGKYSSIVLVASVHIGKHEPEMIRFVKRNLNALAATDNAFITISLSAAGSQRHEATAAQREQSAAGVAQMTRRFVATTGWEPKRIEPVAGALLYTKYNPFLRLVMKWISKQAGGSTDTSRDHVYTDWERLNRFVGHVADEVRSPPRHPGAESEERLRHIK